MALTKKVCISHGHKDDGGLQKLKDLLEPKGMDVRDSSIHTGKFNDATDSGYIKTQILAPAINWAGTFICYVSPQTKDSEWVNWEIAETLRLGKRVVAMYKGNSQPANLPIALRDNGISPIPWTHKGLMDALKD